MSELYESVRTRQSDIIEQNKAQIIISRTIRSDDGAGGYNETTANLSSQDFRIYNKQGRTLNLTDGGWHSQRITKMIAKYDANVQKESAIYLDAFTYNSIKYKIVDVKPIMTQGQIVFKECALEEIT